jgi:hypothetical protein
MCLSPTPNKKKAVAAAAAANIPISALYQFF